MVQNGHVYFVVFLLPNCIARGKKVVCVCMCVHVGVHIVRVCLYVCLQTHKIETQQNSWVYTILIPHSREGRTPSVNNRPDYRGISPLPSSALHLWAQQWLLASKATTEKKSPKNNTVVDPKTSFPSHQTTPPPILVSLSQLPEVVSVCFGLRSTCVCYWLQC